MSERKRKSFTSRHKTKVAYPKNPRFFGRSIPFMVTSTITHCSCPHTLSNYLSPGILSKVEFLHLQRSDSS
jgi:hypothetical protein